MKLIIASVTNIMAAWISPSSKPEIVWSVKLKIMPLVEIGSFRGDSVFDALMSSRPHTPTSAFP